MSSESSVGLLERFAEIEWLIAKIYFRFSHLFLDRTELRDFWWEMANEEEQHGSILSACRSIMNYEENLMPTSRHEPRSLAVGSGSGSCQAKRSESRDDVAGATASARGGTTISAQKADELESWLLSYLRLGTASLGVEEAFRIALEIEGSEVNSIYDQLLRIRGLGMAQTVAILRVPASVHKQKLKSAVRQFCSDPKLLAAADKL